MHLLRAFTAIAIALALGCSASQAATLQPIGDFDQPIYVTSDPGNPNRLFVAERTGKIQQVLGGSTTLFADLSSIIQCVATCNGERGLYSIALAPTSTAAAASTSITRTASTGASTLPK